MAKSIADEATRRGQDPLNWAGLIANKSGFDPTHTGDYGEPGLIRFDRMWLAMMGVNAGDVAGWPAEKQVPFIGEYFDFIQELSLIHI